MAPSSRGWRRIRSCTSRCAPWSRRPGGANIQTIGERVEDANTMTVLWQLGVQYIQGYFVNEPEEVVLRAER
jgi:c-di-GMP-related signal transduction protein